MTVLSLDFQRWYIATYRKTICAPPPPKKKPISTQSLQRLPLAAD